MKTYSRTVRSICVPCCPVMYFPALLGARFLGQPRAFIPAVAAILIPVDCLGETENQFTTQGIHCSKLFA